MGSPNGAAGGRKRGSIRRLGDALQIRVSAGKDPATDERLVLVESVRIDKPGNERSERAAQKEAEKILTRLQGEADSLKVGPYQVDVWRVARSLAAPA
jgi:hypothetical protein